MFGSLFRRGPRRGQSIVEFALVLPVLLFLLLMGLDFGRVFLGWVNLNNAARVGANYAALYPDGLEHAAGHNSHQRVPATVADRLRGERLRHPRRNAAHDSRRRPSPEHHPMRSANRPSSESPARFARSRR